MSSSKCHILNMFCKWNIKMAINVSQSCVCLFYQIFISHSNISKQFPFYSYHITQKADDSAQKYGFGKYLNAEDLDKKYLKWKPTSQRTFWCQLLLQWLGRKVSTSKKIILMFVWRWPYQVHTCFNHDLSASAPVIEAELVIKMFSKMQASI